MKFQTSLGTVSVTPRGRREDKTQMVQAGSAAYALVPRVEDETSSFALDITVERNDKAAMIFPVYSLQVAAETMTGNFPLLVPVQWNRGTPKSRLRGRDNMDVHIVLPTGEFVDIQCGLITRERMFFMTLQQIYKGHVARTRGNKNSVTWTAVPTDPIHDYPGASFQAIWTTRADAFMNKAVDHDASEKLSRIKVAKWQPPALPEPPEGYRVGIVDYFNMISGTGQVHGADGEKRFVHYRAIKHGGIVPTLTPMTVVQFQDKDPEPGQDRRSITVVEPYTPARIEEPVVV